MIKTLGIISANFVDSMGKITELRSLASMPFGGRYRIIDFALSSMINSGINTVCMITPSMYRSIMDHVGAGKDWGLSRKVGGLLILPGSVYGMKAAKGKYTMRDFIQNKVSFERSNADFVLIMSSNQIFNYDFSDAIKEHAESDRDITMFYKSVSNAEDYSGQFLTLSACGKVSNIRTNPFSTDNRFTEIFIIKRTLLLEIINNYSEAAHLDLINVIEENLETFKVGSREISSYIEPIDTISQYMKCSKDLLDSNIYQELFLGDIKIQTKIQDSPPTIYKDDAYVINSIVPAGCVINGRVENSILFRGVKIEEGAVVKNSVILQRSTIEKNAVAEDLICNRNIVISSGTKLYGVPTNPYVLLK